MSNSSDDTQVAYPEVFTLHWEGPTGTVDETDAAFPRCDEETRSRRDAELDAERGERETRDRGQALWEQIRAEAERRGDPTLWEQRLDAFKWVKLEARGNANEYARDRDLNHATVRTWIADVSKLAYQVGFRLHEDRLLLVGEAPPEVLGSARLLVLPNIETLSGSARARRDCWALMKAGGLVAAA